MAEPQPTEEVATNQAQPVSVIHPALEPIAAQPAPAPVAHSNNKADQLKLRKLGIAEFCLGIICLVIGAVITGIQDAWKTSFYSHYSGIVALNTGEGIWCGIWTIITGILGVCAATSSASRCIITTHMAFSIVSSIFSLVMFTLSVVGAIYGDYLNRIYHEVHLVVLNSILCILASILIILHLLSAHFSGAILRCSESACCLWFNQCCFYCAPCARQNDRYRGARIVYTQPPVYMQKPAEGQQIVHAQHPVVYAQPLVSGGPPVVYAQQPEVAFQGAPYAPQGYLIPGAPYASQGYLIPGVQPMAQPTFQGTVSPLNQVVGNPRTEDPVVAEETKVDNANPPPKRQTLQ